jgi:hypothetical protein
MSQAQSPKTRRKAPFTQADLMRALRAVKAVFTDGDMGVRIEPDGAIVIARFGTGGARAVSAVRDFAL